MRKLYEIFKLLSTQKKNSCRGNYIKKYGMYVSVEITKYYHVVRDSNFGEK